MASGSLKVLSANAGEGLLIEPGTGTMRRVCLLLLLAALVGLASGGKGLAQLEQTLGPVLPGPLNFVAAKLTGSEARFADPPVLPAQRRAAAASLITIGLGLILCRLSWWASGSLLTVMMAAWSAAALSASIEPVVPPGPLILAGLVAYGFGLLVRSAIPGEAGHHVRRSRYRDNVLMPRLAASSCAAIITFDGEWLIRSANRAAGEMFGYSMFELAGMPFGKLLAGPERGLLRLPARPRATSCELRARRKNGQCFELGAAFSTMEVDDDRVRIAVLQDITELNTTRRALPLRDEMTGLPERVLYVDRIDQAILAAERAAQPLAVLLVHLKLFNMVGETLGGGFANQLLLQLVARLAECLRRSDTLARLDTAELALLLPGPTDTDVAGQKAAWIAQELNRPFQIEELEVGLEVHIGVATYPLDGRTTHDLMQRAEVAMLAARQTQRAVALYPEAVALRPSEELLLVDELREAIEDNQLFLEFLPKLDLRTGQPAGVEALARWQHPARGAISADRCINLAEQHGLILPMALRVISLAIAQQQVWRNQGIELSVAINLPVDPLRTPQFPAILSQVLKTSHGRADQLLFEITENSIATDPSSISQTLKAMSSMGFQFSLDDFGIGSLSLSCLQKLPIAELKIARSLVAVMAQDPDATVVVRSALSLGDSLGLRVVAEGVEDRQTLDALREVGCAQVQGDFVGPPMTAEKFEQWLNVPRQAERDGALRVDLADQTALSPA
jgi:diguanylate cyclase (GGDEF)-like protein/PAS domain S-box-containing protein